MVRNFAQKVRMYWISTTLRRVYADLRERVILRRKRVIFCSTFNYANNSAIHKDDLWAWFAPCCVAMGMLNSFGRSPDAAPREINWRPFWISEQAVPA